MHDPRLGFDPFAPPVSARRCIAGLDDLRCHGRLYVEELGARRKVYCTDCDYHEFHGAEGKVEIEALRGTAGVTAKPSWNARPVKKEAISHQPSAVSPEPEETQAMSEEANKQCPSCGVVKKRLRKEIGLCGKCDAQLPRGGRPPIATTAPEKAPLTKAAEPQGDLIVGEPLKLSPVVRIKARVVHVEFEGDDETVQSLLKNLGDLLTGKQSTGG